MLNHSRIVDVTEQPNNPQVVLATAQPWYKVGDDMGALFLSTDGGETWEAISTEVSHTFFNFARFHLHKPNVIYAGTAGGGLWSSENAPVTIQSRYSLPQWFELLQNYPNPFNPVTTIQYRLPTAAPVTLIVYALAGQPVKVLVNGHQSTGTHTVELNASGMASGIYFYQLKAGDFQQTRKLLLVR